MMNEQEMAEWLDRVEEQFRAVQAMIEEFLTDLERLAEE